MQLPFGIDLGRAASAAVLALVLYVFAVNETNPETTRLTDYRVPVELVNVPSGLVAKDRVPSIQMRVRASLDVFTRLRPDSFVAQADATNAQPGQNSLFVNVRSTDSGVRDVTAVPSRIDLVFEQVQERSVPVRVNLIGQVPNGYQLGDPKADPSRVTVSGPESVVRQAAEAVVDVNVNRVTVTVNGAYTPRVVDPRGNELQGLTTRPPAVSVEVPIVQQAQFKEVGVRPNIQGRPAPGYLLEPVEVDPPTVTVVGEPSALESVNFVETAPINVDGLSSPAVRRVGLAPPPNTALVQPGQTVLVTLRVQPLSITQTLRVLPQVQNVPPGVVLAKPPDSVNVTISGPAPTLANLTARDIRVVLDLNGRPSGVYQIDAKIENLPGGMTVDKVEPKQVTVDLREAATTPTPVPATTAGTPGPR